MAMAVKFNTGQEVCLQIPRTRAVMQVKEGTSGSKARVPGAVRWRPLHSQEMPTLLQGNRLWVHDREGLCGHKVHLRGCDSHTDRRPWA
jgi:hypothetical protein